MSVKYPTIAMFHDIIYHVLQMALLNFKDSYNKILVPLLAVPLGTVPYGLPLGRGVGYNQILELSFWHPGGTSAHKNKVLVKTRNL